MDSRWEMKALEHAEEPHRAHVEMLRRDIDCLRQKISELEEEKEAAQEAWQRRQADLSQLNPKQELPASNGGEVWDMEIAEKFSLISLCESDLEQVEMVLKLLDDLRKRFEDKSQGPAVVKAFERMLPSNDLRQRALNCCLDTIALFDETTGKQIREDATKAKKMLPRIAAASSDLATLLREFQTLDVRIPRPLGFEVLSELSRASVEADESDLTSGNLTTSAPDSNLTTPDALDTLARLAKETASEFSLLMDPADPTFESRKGGEPDLIRKLLFVLEQEIRITSGSDSLRPGFAFPSDAEFAAIAWLLLDTSLDPDAVKQLRRRTKLRSRK